MRNFNKILTLAVVVTAALALAKKTPRKATSRIYHGTDASVGEFPFVGLLTSFSRFLVNDDATHYEMGQCGASILSSRIVLTAAHCVVTDKWGMREAITLPRNLQFIAGETNRKQYEGAEQSFSIKGLIVHEEYDTVTYANDIAMLITDEDIKFNEKVQPISLPEEADMDQLYAEGAPITVIGWGATETANVSMSLKKLPYVVVSKATCTKAWGPKYILPGMMCSGESPMTEEHASNGDSGGPLFTKSSSGDWVQLGLVSWGPTNEQKADRTWDVNSDVSFYKIWINDHIALSLSDYVTELYAENEEKSISFTNLRNFLYKTITIRPENSTKYTTITFKSGKLVSVTGDQVTVYNGDSVTKDKQLVQLAGTIAEQTVTATTNKGLTVVIMTGENPGEKSEGFTLGYRETDTPGGTTALHCADGYAACSDKYYCLRSTLFCDGYEYDGFGECRDGSDEAPAKCDPSYDGNDDDTKNENSAADGDSENSEDEEKNSRTRPNYLSGFLIALTVIICIDF